MSRMVLLIARRSPGKWVLQASLIRFATCMWIWAACPARWLATSKAEFPRPMMATRWFS